MFLSFLILTCQLTVILNKLKAIVWYITYNKDTDI